MITPYPLELPAALADKLLAFVAERHPLPARLRKRPLAGLYAESVTELSRAFTTDREDRRPDYLSAPRLRAAYLVYFLVTGAATAIAAMARTGLDFRESDVPLRVLDLGSGPLSASIGAGYFARSRPLDVTAVDRSGAALKDGRDLFAALHPTASVRTVQSDLRDRRLRSKLGRDVDLVIAANVFNEWPDRKGSGIDDAAALCATLLEQHISPNGTLLIIEPAARASSRRLIALRERLVELGAGHISAPCVGAEHCPLAPLGMRDWCHSERTWQRPAHIEAIDKAIGHRRDTLKFSFLALTPTQPEPRSADSYRAIGGLMRDERAVRRYLCGPDGRIVVQGKRSLADTHPLIAAERGDLLQVHGERKTVRRGKYNEEVLVLRGDRNG